MIFSEWLDVLLVLENALAANGVRFLRAGGGKPCRGAPAGRGGAAAAAAAAVAAFQSDPSVAALLLPVARGANGLNLVEARHVIMVEPLMDPGAEAQAVKRVDRIGQVGPTCVHRFVVCASIEENIHALFAPRVARAAAAGEAGAGAGAGDGGAEEGGGGAEGRRGGLRASEVVSLLRQ